MKIIKPNCPICGKQAYINCDVPDGFYMGWSVGCVSYKENDNVHLMKASRHNLCSEKECIKWWERFVNKNKR